MSGESVRGQFDTIVGRDIPCTTRLLSIPGALTLSIPVPVTNVPLTSFVCPVTKCDPRSETSGVDIGVDIGWMSLWISADRVRNASACSLMSQ